MENKSQIEKESMVTDGPMAEEKGDLIVAEKSRQNKTKLFFINILMIVFIIIFLLFCTKFYGENFLAMGPIIICCLIIKKIFGKKIFGKKIEKDISKPFNFIVKCLCWLSGIPIAICGIGLLALGILEGSCHGMAMFMCFPGEVLLLLAAVLIIIAVRSK